MHAALRHEFFLAPVVALGVAVVLIWLLPPYLMWLLSGGAGQPEIANPVTTIIGDAGDPLAQSWIVAWNGHALAGDLGRLWNTNAFFPEQYGLAFTDSMIGYAPAGLIGDGMAAAVLRYNILFVLVFALASVGAYALARQLGAGRVGAAVAGAVFAYAPWRYGHNGHLNILSSGGIVLALAMLARGHGWSLRHGYRPERVRPGWIVAGWVVAAWQISLGFGIGLPFMYLLLLACVVSAVGWLVTGRPPLRRGLVLADLGGGLFFAAVTGALALVYQHVRDLNPEIVRTWDYVDVFSPTWRGLLVAPYPSLLWGDWHEPARAALGDASNEKVLLCGFVLYGLAVAGLFYSIWTVRQRVLLAAGVVIGLLFTFGTKGPVYRLLYDYVPGIDGMRTPGRLILWPTLLLAILAAGLVTRLGRSAAASARPGRGRFAARIATVPLLLLVVFEGIPDNDHPPVPAIPAALAAAPGPVLVLPSDEYRDLQVMLWSTEKWPTLVNGASGITPRGHQEVRDVMQSFPSEAAVAKLRQLGIRSVVVLPGWLDGTPYGNVLSIPPAPGVERVQYGNDVLFVLR